MTESVLIYSGWSVTMDLGLPLDGKINERGLGVTISKFELGGKQHHWGKKEKREEKGGLPLEQSRGGWVLSFHVAGWHRGREAGRRRERQEVHHQSILHSVQIQSRDSHQYSHRTTIIEYRCASLS